MAIRRKHYRSTTMIRFICWILSSCGLAWQVRQISEVYFQFQTQVDMNIEAPHNITMPGLTMCIKIVYNETLLKQVYPESEQLIDWSKKVQLNFSILRYVPIKYLANLKTTTVKIKCKAPFPELNDTAPQADSDLCEAKGMTRTTIHFNPMDDLFFHCTTYFHCPTLPSPYQVVRADDKDFYKVLIYSKSGLDLNQKTSIIAYAHNPMEILHAAEADSFHFFIEQTENMILASWKSITELLPAPYRTNCKNYSDVEYGRTGCIYSCRRERSPTSCSEIWPWNVPATIDSDKPFDLKDENCSIGVKPKCEGECPAQCINYWYTTTLVASIEKRTPSNMTSLYVRRPFGVEITYKYLARMSEIEFLCYIASCFGIWLGVSFLDITYLLADLFFFIDDNGPY